MISLRHAALLATGLAAAATLQAAPPEASVVRVLCTTSVRSTTGTGVVVGARRVLTSQQVVACAGQGGQISVGSAGRVLPATLDWSSPSRDLALVSTSEALGREVVRLSRTAALEGADVRVVGFPGPGALDGAVRLRDAAFVATVLPGVLTGSERSGGAIVHQTDAALSPGLRGAPVLDACGDLVALVGESGGDTGARLRLLGRDAVAEAVQGQRLDVSVATDGCAPATGAVATPAAPAPERAAIPSWMWAVALGVLLAGLLPLLARGRRRTGRSVDASPASRSPAAGEILAARPPPGPAPAGAAPTPLGSGWALVGLPGHLGGTRTPVDGRIRIGRDPASCELVVPEQAPAVSKRHAVVWVDGGVAWIQDASTNGTFVDGRRLERNRPEPLPEGATVTLATPATGVRLERS